MQTNTIKWLILFVILLGNISAFSQTKDKKHLTDEELLTLVQKQTFRYFWDFAHPESGLAHERSNGRPEVATIGGSGFGVMAIIVGVERGFVTRDEGAERMLKIVNFLNKDAQSYHGIWPHWLNGKTGETIPFSRKDDGADLVESAFMFEGLLAAHQYFNQETNTERRIRGLISKLWREAEWNWFTQGGQEVLYWHWSPNNDWTMNHQIKGHNECHIAYILAAASPTFSVKESVYHRGWANSTVFRNGKEYYAIKLPLGTEYGGPLFFTHYSYLGLDPRGLKDRYADYEEQMKAHTLINRAYCIDNPKKYKGYGKKCWGLTASDGDKGYSAHSPRNDRGVITPTAAISSIPYTPEYSIEAMRYFYEELGENLWGEYGFKDAFNLTENWFAPSYLAIDQGPIIVMIENYRTQLIWKLFMSHPDVQTGLKKLGFTSPYLNK
ncbi:glucoamylase family protein [Bacteroides sp. 51]|uniref:glucoamylase family protein n=1 Tax=Bacteroides sp. 51 TaxID=2302938 RepID=UPI00194032BC|nr:glucoamylase family protein [Bacteroides sp. 51]